MYIVFEGTVGTGKTTQSKKLVEYFKKKDPNKQVLWAREPGGDEISENIRKAVQGTRYKTQMEPICEAYLYAASRAQSLRTLIKPVLDNDGIVIADRSFISSMAFQAFARDLGIQKVLEINSHAIEGFIPDLVIYIDLDIEVGLERSFDPEGDKWERETVKTFKKIEEGYKKVSKHKMFKDKWITIDGSKSKEGVFEDIKASVVFD